LKFILFFLNWLGILYILFFNFIFFNLFSFLAILCKLIEIKHFFTWWDNLSLKSNLWSSNLILTYHRILFLFFKFSKNLSAEFRISCIFSFFKNFIYISIEITLSVVWITNWILWWVHLLKLKVGGLLWYILTAYFFHYFLERF